MAQKSKRSYKFLWALLIVIGLPIAFNLLSGFMHKRYTAEMRMMVDESTQTPQEMLSPYQSYDDLLASGRPRSPQTQLDILTGTVVLTDAIRIASQRLPEKIKLEGHEDEVYQNLVRRLQVDNELGSDIITLRVTDNDPEVAAELANDIGLAYVDYSKRVAHATGALLTEQLKARTDALKQKLTDIDAKISEVKSKSNVYDITAAETNMGSTKEFDDRNLATLQASYEGAKAQLVVAESELKSVPQYIETGSHTQVNPLAVTLQQSLASERVTLAQLQAQYQDNFPTVKEEKKKIADLQAQLAKVQTSIPSGVDRAINPVYQNQLTSVQNLRAQVESYSSQVTAAVGEQRRVDTSLGQLPKTEQVLQSLLRDQKVTEETYEQLGQRQSAIQANGMARQPLSQIVSTALPPSTPSFPDHKLLTMMGLAIGVFFAVLVLMPRPHVPGEPQEEAAKEARIPLQPQPEAPAPAVAAPRTFAEAIQHASKPALTPDEFEALSAFNASAPKSA